MSEASPQGGPTLLHTKLHRPIVPGYFLCRPRLNKLLSRCLDTPLTLISAPAGYGKSHLVSHWVGHQDVPCAWLSLENSDSDIEIFVDYLLAAIEAAAPDSVSETQQMVQAADRPAWSVVIKSIANELEALHSPLVLILDDYHLIDSGSDVHGLMRDILEHPPGPLHLVILTRHDPPFHLATRRANGELTELRLKELQFTALETKTLLKNVLDQTVSDDALNNIQQELEGWAAGLRLVSLALRGAQDYDSFLKNLHGGIQYTQNYLMQEVINGLSPQLKDWLLRTSLLERFCGDLCDVVGVSDSDSVSAGFSGAEFVRNLQECNLFTIALDSQGTWFRYHHLFQELLQNELEKCLKPVEISAIYSRTSTWFEQQDMIEDAIKYSIKGQEINHAVEIFDRHRRDEQDLDHWRKVEKWLSAFTVEVKVQRPELLLAQAWVLHDRYQLGGLAPIVERLESFSTQETLDDVSAGELRFFQGMLQFWAADWESSQKLFVEAQALIPELHPRIAGLIEIYLALTMYLNGQEDVALENLDSRLLDDSFLVDALTSRLLLARCFIHTLSGALPRAAQDGRSVARIAGQGGKAYMEGWGRYFEGASHFHANDLEAAQSCFEPSFDQRYSMHTRAAIDSMVALALVYQFLQQPDAATKTMERLLAFAEKSQDAQHLITVYSGQARLDLVRGDIKSASSWLRSFNEQPAWPSTFIWLEVSTVTQARVLVATSSEKNLSRASQLLASLRETAEAQRNCSQIIDILVLQSLLYAKQGKEEKSLSILENALGLAEPGGYIRPFLEPGPAIAELLSRLGQRQQDRSWIDRVLLSFPNKVPPVPPEMTGPDISHGKTTHAPDDLVEELTNREEQVLELLGQRLRDKEIARQLSISPQTVNFHLKNIYRKLGVSNRRDAATRAC